MGDKHLPVGAIDVTASALAKVAPRALTARIDQARHDLRALVGRRPAMAKTPGSSARAPRPLAEIDPLEHLLPTSRLRRRYVTWRTDLRWLARDLRGGGRSPTIEGRASRYRPASSPRDALVPRSVEVVARTQETPDAVTLELVSSGRALTFEAGQFLTFHVRVDGETLRRAYSLCRSPREGTLAVTVKRIDGGRVSGWLHTHAKIGQRLEVLGPSGNFVLPSEEAGPDGVARELLLVAGGSGITPIRALAKAALDRGWRVHLAYGNRSDEDVIFGSELRAWTLNANFSLTEALETAPAGFVGIDGRLDEPAVHGWLTSLPAASAPRLAYVCGPAPMRDGAVSALRESGLPSSSIFEERFQSPGQTAARGPAVNRTVTLQVLGERRRVEVAAGHTVLEAGLDAGVALPFSCAMGGCAACKVTLKRGEVEMDEPNCLSPAERAEGAVLTCCARPLSDDVVLEVPS